MIVAAWAAIAATMGAGAAMATEPIAVAAAGSLKAPLTSLGTAFEKLNGGAVHLSFGASGLLLERIRAGEKVDVFVSANMEHPGTLARTGWAMESHSLARNSMCLLAASGVAVATDTVINVILDPEIKLGTSTPGADPSGDYAWEVFRRAEALRPGAFALLSGKARTLTGGPRSPPPPKDRNVYGELVARGDADVFLTYCTNARLAIAEVSALRSVTLPENLAVGATYGIAVRRDAPRTAQAFAGFLLSPEGQRRLAAFGFDAP